MRGGDSGATFYIGYTTIDCLRPSMESEIVKLPHSAATLRSCFNVVLMNVVHEILLLVARPPQLRRSRAAAAVIHVRLQEQSPL